MRNGYVADPTEWLRDEFLIEADRYELDQDWLEMTIDRLEKQEMQKALELWNRLWRLKQTALERGVGRWKILQIDIALERARQHVHAAGGEVGRED